MNVVGCRLSLSRGRDEGSHDQESQREILPIPDRPYTGLVTYDAKDPDPSFPPIEPLRPPVGSARAPR